MARQSKIAGEVSSIFGDLAKIAMSNTANKRAQELQLETNLIELELRTLNKNLANKEEIYRLKQEQFQSTTGQAFKLSDEARTPGFEKAITSISDPMLQGHVDEINSTKGQISTLESQIASITELQQGPLADITAFYQGAADPAFSGDETIIEASDMTPEALTAYLGDKYEGVDPNIIAGASAKIRATTALDQMQVLQSSSELQTKLIGNQNIRTRESANAPFVDVKANMDNIAVSKRTLSSLVDTDILINQMSTTYEMEQVKDLYLASAIDPDVTGTRKTLAEESLAGAQASLDGRFYMVGSALLGEANITLEEYIELNGPESAQDIIDHGEQYYNAVKSAIPTKARPQGTNIPAINLLVESNQDLIDEQTGQYRDDIDWDRIEDVTGYTEDMWKRNIPLMKDTLDAIRHAEASNAKQSTQALGGVVSSVPVIEDDNLGDPEDIDYTSGVLDPNLIYEPALLALSNISETPEVDFDYFSPFESDESDPFETYSAELDFEDGMSASEQEEYYASIAPQEYNDFRNLVNRKDEIVSELDTMPYLGGGDKGEALRDELGSFASQLMGRGTMDSKIANAKEEIEFAVNKLENESKTLESFALSLAPNDPDFLESLLEQLNVDADTKLYSIDLNELIAAAEQAMPAGALSPEDLDNLSSMIQKKQLASRTFWSNRENVRRESMNNKLSQSGLSDSFWDLFTVKQQ